MKFLRSTISYAKPYGPRYFYGVSALIAVDTLSLLVPQIIRNFANDFQSGNLHSSQLITYALLTLGAGILMAAGRFFWRLMLNGSGRRVEYDIRKRLFHHWLELEQEFYNHRNTGELMAYATNDINTIRSMYAEGVMVFIDSTFMLLLSIVMMIQTTGLKFTLLTLIPVPFILLCTLFFGRRIHPSFMAQQRAYADLSQAAHESFSGIGVIKAFVNEEHTKENFESYNSKFFEKSMATNRLMAVFNPLLNLLSGTSFLLAAYFGAKGVIDGSLLLGDFVAHFTYLGIIAWPIRGIGYLVSILQRGSVSMGRIDELLEIEPKIKDPVAPLPIPTDRAKVEFENVSFQYPGQPNLAIQNISFTLEDGKTLALVGKTGSGKSTIAKVLFRQYDVENGTIRIDGVPLKEIRRQDLAKKSAYVPQDGFLFSETLDENIAFAYDCYPGDEEVYEAAKMSGIYGDIMDFSKGFKTLTGERGATLSGGQQQRVAIARALIKKPRLLVLDDSLSAVDTNTEKNILKSLKDLDCTTIIIAHRISTIKDADEILYMDHGEVLERGNHESLLARNGEYARMYQNQLLEEELKGGSHGKESYL